MSAKRNRRREESVYISRMCQEVDDDAMEDDYDDKIDCHM